MHCLLHSEPALPWMAVAGVFCFFFAIINFGFAPRVCSRSKKSYPRWMMMVAGATIDHVRLLLLLLLLVLLPAHRCTLSADG